MERGPCGRSGGRRVGGGTLGVSDGLAVGLGGNGLFGGWDGLLMKVGGSSFSGAGRLGKSLAGGGGGTTIHGRFPISLIRPSLPPDRENPIRNSFSRSIPVPAKSMVAVVWSTHGVDVVWQTNGISRRCPADETKVG